MDYLNFDRFSMFFDKIIINFDGYDQWCDGILIILQYVYKLSSLERGCWNWVYGEIRCFGNFQFFLNVKIML